MRGENGYHNLRMAAGKYAPQKKYLMATPALRQAKRNKYIFFALLRLRSFAM